MENIKYAISIGGTGARCMESLIHLCAAGLGPEKLSIFFIDPDKDNGNLTRTRNLISTYMDCRRNLIKTERAESIFKTEISITSPQDTWTIFNEPNQTLEKYIGYQALSNDMRNFVDILYSKEELSTDLAKGFRGHPAIGAAVMAAPNEEQNPWKKLIKELANVQAKGAMEVFIMGSIFGGTGAAGFSTIGYYLKNHPKAGKGEGRSKLKLGGALILPYFSFEPPPSELNEMFVEASDFPLAAKASLKYYHAKNIGYDEVYFVGDEGNRRIGKEFSTGASLQENESHFVEFISALSARDFYNNPADPENVEPPKYFIAGRENDSISWSNLPISRKEDGLNKESNEIKIKMATLATFCYAYIHEAYPRVVENDHGKIKVAWYRNNFNKSRVFGSNLIYKVGEKEEELKRIKDYCEKFIRWSSQISNEGKRVGLFNKEKLNSDPNKSDAAISELIKNMKGTGKEFPTLVALTNTIHIDKSIDHAMGRLISLFYEASHKYVLNNYDISE